MRFPRKTEGFPDYYANRMLSQKLSAFSQVKVININKDYVQGALKNVRKRIVNSRNAKNNTKKSQNSRA